jgi:MarR family transcriptional regulator for hemolysin
MLKDALQKLVGQKETLKSYDILRLQAKTYRLMRYMVDRLLKEHNLKTLDWSILGLLDARKEGMRFTEIAREMGVEPPFITELISKLEKKSIVTSKDNPQDRRAKLIELTKKGQKKVEEIEKQLYTSMSEFLKEISSNEVATYKNVMNKMETLLEKITL